MGFTGNFTSVRLGTASRSGGQTIVVEGRSVPADPGGELHVAMPHGGKLLVADVNAAGLTEWVATFADVDPPIKVGEDVFVIGVAMRPEPCDPFVWQGSLALGE